MENYTFTKEQLNDFIMMTDGMSDYQGSCDSPPLFEEFCEETFGENWSELMVKWDCLFDMEFEADIYIYLSTGYQTDDLRFWIKESKERLSEILAEQN